jgi:tetratricopeptide (TPR) repeat protein
VADTYRLQKLYDQAAAWVETTLSIQADYAWAHYQRGLIVQEGQQYEAATAAFKKAFELDPCETEFSYNVGWSLLEELKFDDSEQWARKTLELDAKHVAAQNLVGALAFLRRRWSDAAQIFRRVAALDPSDSILPCNAASAHMRMGQFAEADEQLAIALRIDPEAPSAYHLLALLHHLTDRPEAAQHAERARALKQDFDSLLVFAITRSAAAATTGPNGSLEAFEQALNAASPLDREQSAEIVIYALSLLQSIHGTQARAVMLQNVSPVWESFRQAISHLDDIGDPSQEPPVAAIISALRSPLMPKEQLLTSWASGISVWYTPGQIFS